MVTPNVYHGVELPGNGTRLTSYAKDTIEALEPTLIKARFDQPLDDLDWCIDIARRYTAKPWVHLRPIGEVPEVADVMQGLNRIYSYLLGKNILITLETQNEPNHPKTAPDLGATITQQIATYRKRLTDALIIKRLFSQVKLVAPGLMPSESMYLWEIAERSQFDFDGFHLYGNNGANGLMLPNGFKATPIATEAGHVGRYDDPQRAVKTIEMMEIMHQRYNVDAFCIFIVGYNGIGEENAPFALQLNHAQQYAQWARRYNTTMTPEEIAKFIFDDAYSQLTGEGQNEDNAFERYVLIHPEVGMPIGRVRGYDNPSLPVIYQARALGTLVVPKSNTSPEAVRFARSWRELRDLLLPNR